MSKRNNANAGGDRSFGKENGELVLFHASPEAMMIVDENRQILDVNRAFCKLFKRSREQLVGQKSRTLYPNDAEFERTWAARQASITHRDVPIAYADMIKGDGSTFPASIVGGSMRDRDDRRLAIFGTVRDLSEQVAREQSLIAEREALEQLYTRTPALLHSVDREGRIIHVSDEWLRHFGYSADEVLGQYWRSFLTEPSRRFSKTVLRPQFWRDGRCHRVPFEMISRDGEIIEIELSAVTNTRDGVETSLSCSEDVTARNRALRSAQQQNAALRDFAAFASHDLQSPLRHIRLFSEQMEEIVADSDEACAIAAQIREKAALAQEMIESLLDFSRAAYGGFKKKHVDLTQAAALALRMVENDVQQSHARIEVGELPAVLGDLNLLARVFQNLIANAIKHGGVAPPQIRIRAAAAKQSGALVEISIEDNGIGIADAYSERAFAAYETFDAEGLDNRGAGLGLSICRQIVNSHGGEIWVDRTFKSGARICFTLRRQNADISPNWDGIPAIPCDKSIA